MSEQRWYLGTTGFSFPDWGRSFYPGSLGAAARLGWYARQFNALELDTTFHAIPPRERASAWAAAVPQGFRFAAKAPKTLTHGELKLDGPVAKRTVPRLLKALEPLGPKLAVVLLQFPPSFRFRRFAELESLLGGLPTGHCRYAVELRHADWWHRQTAELFQELGIAWVTADEADRSVAGLPPHRVPQGCYQPRSAPRTADFLYLRWLGQHEQFPDLGREHLDPQPRLQWWYRQLSTTLAAQSAPGGVFGFFNNGFAGHAPASCRRFMAMVRGEETAREAPVRQPGLFDRS
ncbi:uncharacterized protein YecE (DUF72 family) [Natronocella acetinitrilica]|uniref:Uncharacterized protein YecE (DUF72 family) n=1 Tax=Natronocella acetinitrilica TaxID=414046 RepID=A0AAE3G5S6_9GAMM|nr:DUF72 domain-containing protein [Natronocella acetinitrilica]MCP1675554.1 uncharacterized protein YecE (DUF72 family) [Natronocella acetinitrilica]